MGTLILHPTPLAEWQALVLEAKDRNSYSITQEIECYLIFLLMRFASKPEIANSIVALDFLKNIEQFKQESSQVRQERLESLKDLGDKCLLFAGLFPGRAQKRRVRISYYVRLGQMAYSSLSEEKNSNLAELYADLAEHFVILMDIMHCMREIDENVTAIDLLQAEELWSDTRSLHALSTLKKSTQGFMPANIFPFHFNHHPNTSSRTH